jgi:hypothetical protein
MTLDPAVWHAAEKHLFTCLCRECFERGIEIGEMQMGGDVAPRNVSTCDTQHHVNAHTLTRAHPHMYAHTQRAE